MFPDDKQPRIDVKEAARIIYGTPEPDLGQLGKVRALILRGALQGSADGCWSTAEAVAEFLAAVKLNQHQRSAEQASPVPTARQAQKQRHSATVRQDRPYYRALFKEYFLAVIHRQRDQGVQNQPPSRRFEQAVLAGQIGLLAVSVAIGVMAVMRIRQAAEPQELTLVRAWIRNDASRYSIVRWYPPQPLGDGTSIRVVYSYAGRSVSSKVIQTDRVFVIRNNQVTVQQDADDDG